MDAVVNPPQPNEPSYELFYKVVAANTNSPDNVCGAVIMALSCGTATARVHSVHLIYEDRLINKFTNRRHSVYS